MPRAVLVLLLVGLLAGACGAASARSPTSRPRTSIRIASLIDAVVVAPSVPPDEIGASPSADASPATDPSPGLGGSFDPSASPSFDPTTSPGPSFVIPDLGPWPARVPDAPAKVAWRGPRENIIALTIDDGNDPETCRREFDYLRANHIKATFFPTWVGVHKDKALWREIADAGYPIGDHTLTHRDLTEPGIADHSIIRQLAGSRSKIEKVIGHPMLPVFRPTFGAFDDRVLAIAGSLDFHTAVMWGSSAGDSGPNSTPKGMTRAALQGGRGDIILMHCNHAVSADILPAIVQGYLDRGWTFVTIPELLRWDELGLTVPDPTSFPDPSPGASPDASSGPGTDPGVSPGPLVSEDQVPGVPAP